MLLLNKDEMLLIDLPSCCIVCGMPEIRAEKYTEIRLLGLGDVTSALHSIGLIYGMIAEVEDSAPAERLLLLEDCCKSQAHLSTIAYPGRIPTEKHESRIL